MGWQAKVTRLPDPDNPLHLPPSNSSRTFPITPTSRWRQPFPRRRTDRRVYSASPVPGGDIAQMAARAARSGVLRQVDALDRMRAIVRQAVQRHLTDDDDLRELTAWNGRHNSVAGVPARSTPPPHASAPIPGRVFAGVGLAQPLGVSSAADNAAILVLGTKKDDRLARLRAGEAVARSPGGVGPQIRDFGPSPNRRLAQAARSSNCPDSSANTPPESVGPWSASDRRRPPSADTPRAR